MSSIGRVGLVPNVAWAACLTRIKFAGCKNLVVNSVPFPEVVPLLCEVPFGGFFFFP